MANPEQSLKITDGIYIVLRSWRRIIIFAIIGALLLLGFALYRNHKTITDNSPESASEIILTDKEIEDITKDVLARDLTIMRHNKRIEALNNRVGVLINRIDNSIYLTIDENAQPFSSFEIAIKPEEPSEIAEDTLEQRRYFLGLDYLKYAKSNDFYIYLSKAVEGGIDADWLHELIECKLVLVDTLHVEVTAPDHDTVKILSQATQKFFLHEIRELLSIDFLYQAEISNLQSKTVKNPDIRIKRENLQKELDDAMNSIRDEQAGINSIVDDALEKERAVIQAMQAEQGGANSPLPAKQSVLIGFFLGFMVAAFLAIYQAMSSDVIYYVDEFAEQLGFLYIGSIVVPEELASKSFGSGIDRWLERRFWGRRKGQTVAHMGAPYVASVINGLLGRDADPCASDDPAVITSLTVAVLGDGDESVPRALVEAINDDERGSTACGVEYQLVGVSVQLDTEDGVKMLQSSDATVILIRPRMTKISKAMRALRIAEGMGKQVLGVVSADRAL